MRVHLDVLLLLDNRPPILIWAHCFSQVLVVVSLSSHWGHRHFWILPGVSNGPTEVHPVTIIAPHSNSSTLKCKCHSQTLSCFWVTSVCDGKSLLMPNLSVLLDVAVTGLEQQQPVIKPFFQGLQDRVCGGGVYVCGVWCVCGVWVYYMSVCGMCVRYVWMCGVWCVHGVCVGMWCV